MLSALGLNFVAPILFSGPHHRNGTSISTASKLNIHGAIVISIITIGASLATLKYSELICAAMLGEAFRGLGSLLPWTVLAAGIFECAQMLSLRLQAQLDIKALMKIKGVLSILGVILNVVGAHFYGIEGVVLALLVFSALYCGAIGIWIFSEEQGQNQRTWL